MSSAARQRLRRFDNANQPTLGAAIDAVVDPVLPAPVDDEAAETAFRDLADRVRPLFVAEDDPWLASPYAWVKHLPSASRGRAGVALVERWARAAGLDVTGRRGPGHDLVAGNQRLEVKMSTQWASGEYTFQAVRDGDYDTLVLLGISPQAVHLWLVPRHLGLGHVERPGGAGGWLTVPADAPPTWLNGHGGSLTAARAVAAAQWPARDTDTGTDTRTDTDAETTS